jgi:hypothetical protein
MNLLTDESIQKFKKQAQGLRKRFEDITDAQIFSELEAGLGAYRNDETILEQLEVLIAKSKSETFDARKGKRSAVPVRSVGTRCRMKNYPDYCIDPQGDVWDVDGKLVSKRWKNQRCWVRIYDHTGKRCERNVFWLLVEAGFVLDPRKRAE